MPTRIHFGVNLNFAKYVYSPRRALEIARDLGVRRVEMVSDIDFGPAFYLRSPEAFRAHHRSAAEAASELGIEISSVLTTYRDSGAIGSPNPDIRESARLVGRSILEQAACYGAHTAGISFFTANRDEVEDPASFDRAYAAALEIWKGWMTDAKRLGLRHLLIEMAAAHREACSTIDDTRETLRELAVHHQAHPDSTVPVGLCYDTGHGISARESPEDDDRDYRAWLRAFPGATREIHLKNTDRDFLATWHFTEAVERSGRGIISLTELLSCVRDTLTVPAVLLFLEVPGKRGRLIGEEQALEEHRESIERTMEALREVGYKQDSDGTWTA